MPLGPSVDFTRSTTARAPTKEERRAVSPFSSTAPSLKTYGPPIVGSSPIMSAMVNAKFRPYAYGVASLGYSRQTFQLSQGRCLPCGIMALPHVVMQRKCRADGGFGTALQTAWTGTLVRTIAKRLPGNRLSYEYRTVVMQVLRGW